MSSPFGLGTSPFGLGTSPFGLTANESYRIRIFNMIAFSPNYNCRYSTMPQPQIHTYPNGLRVVYESSKTKTHVTYIRSFCHVGSIHEPPELKGAAHFIEHMCFKGSRHYSTYSDVISPFSQSGAYFNASTDKQYTVYKINCLDSYVESFLKVLADMIFESEFDKTEYKRELNVVREEVKMEKPKSFVERLLFRGTTYANEVDEVSYHKSGCLPYDKVLDFYREYYVPENMVLSIVSSIPFKTLIRYIDNTIFSNRRSDRNKIVRPIMNAVLPEISSNCESEYAFKSGEGDTARIEIGVRVCNQFNSDEFYKLNVLRHIVGGSMSSRLFVELREKRGLTYHPGANMILYEPAGVFILYAVSDVERIIRDGKNPGVIPIMFDILDDLVKNGVKDVELKTTKMHIRESLKMRASVGEERCGYNGVRLMLHNETEIMSNDQIYDRCYKSIDKADINELIRKYFAPRKYYFSVSGGKLPNKSVLTRILEK